jgi:ribosomal protein S18 acetylase RimI-like enzyme
MAHAVRRAGAADASEIARVINAAFEVEREFRRGARTSGSEIEAMLQRDPFLVIDATPGHVAAAVHVRITGPVGYFGMLAVDPQIQGGGLGRTLLRAAEQFCRESGCTTMTLSTGEDRRDVIAWYERLGYRITRVEESSNPAFSRPIRVVHMEAAL